MPATANRNTPRRVGEGARSYRMAATAHGYAGTIAVLAAGLCTPGVTGTDLIAVGVFDAEADNSAGADGAMQASVQRGVYRFDNSAAADEIALSDIGQLCYIVDDITVAKTAAIVGINPTRSVAGVIDDVDDDGVWVRIDPSFGALA